MSQPPLPAAILARMEEQANNQAAKRLRAAFVRVFGLPGRNTRSTEQRLVVKHLRKCGFADSPVFQTIDGRCDPLAAAQRDGARTIILIIDRQLELAKGDDPEGDEKKKVKVVR